MKLKNIVIADIVFIVAFIIIFTSYIYISFFILKDYRATTLFGGVVLLLLLISVRIFKRANLVLRRELKKKETQLKLLELDKFSDQELLTTLQKLIHTFSGEKDLHTALRELILIVKNLLKVEILFLELYSDEENKYFARIYEGEEKISMSKNLRKDVIEKGQSYLINNLRFSPRYREFGRHGYSSLLATPLKRREHLGRGEKKQDRHLGMIGVLSKEPHDFTSKELDLLSAVASQASLLVENAQLLEKTKLLSMTDGLTNIYNHRHFQERLQEEMENTSSFNQPLSLIIGDIDNFKLYNDHEGHLSGDKALQKIAEILKKNTKGKDVVARYGGEEFVIILPQTSKKDAKKVAEKLRREIQEYKFQGEEKQPQSNLTISFGVSSFPDDDNSPNELIREADRRLYRAKMQGKNQVVWQ